MKSSTRVFISSLSILISSELAFAQCFPYTGSSVCAPWSRYQINAFTGYYTSPSTADAWVLSNTPNSPGFVAYAQSHWNCTGVTAASAATLRYQTSLFCDYIVDIATYDKCNDVATVPHLCRAVAMTAYSALVAMFNNPALCPGTNTAKSGLLKNMETYISHLPTADAATCITGSASDATLCGFTDATQKTSYCAANAGDRCCGTNTVNPAPTGIPPVPSAGSGGLATVTGTATGVGYVPTPTVSVASNNNQTNTINLFGQKVPAPYVIGGAVGAGVLLLAVIGVVVFVIRKRRAAKDDINSPVEHPTLFKNKFKRDPSLPRDSNQFSQPGQMQQQQQFNQSPYKYPPAAAQGAWSEQGFQQADDTAVLSPAPIAQDEELPPAETMEVAFNYVPNLSDEIYLYVGDPIIVKCKFDDGWAFGFNMTTKQEGCFPVACVVPLNTAAATDTESQTKSKTQSIISAKDYKKRQSSLYAPSNIVKGLPDEWQTDSNNNTNMDVNNTYSVYTSAQGNQRETQYTEYTNDPRQTQYTQYTETQYTEANNRDTQYTEYTQYTGAGNNRETQYTEYTQYTEGTNFGNRPYTEYTEYTVAPSSRK